MQCFGRITWVAKVALATRYWHSTIMWGQDGRKGAHSRTCERDSNKGPHDRSKVPQGRWKRPWNKWQEAQNQWQEPQDQWKGSLDLRMEVDRKVPVHTTIANSSIILKASWNQKTEMLYCFIYWFFFSKLCFFEGGSAGFNYAFDMTCPLYCWLLL